MTVSEPLVSNYERVLQEIRSAADRAHRGPEEIMIVAVTKGVPVDRIRHARALGLRRFGENRIQEALPKIAALEGEGCEWHLIGHLQTNKARYVPGRFSMVQSLDGVRLVDALVRRLAEGLDVLVEVNVGEEPQKTGALPADLDVLVRAVLESGHLRLRGLMAMAPESDNPDDARPVFRRLRQLRDELSQRFGIGLPHLSMGMTHDFPVAVEEGTTMLRLGRALFGSPQALRPGGEPSRRHG